MPSFLSREPNPRALKNWQRAKEFVFRREGAGVGDDSALNMSAGLRRNAAPRRYGDELIRMLRVWKSEHADRDFFEWLTSGGIAGGMSAKQEAAHADAAESYEEDDSNWTPELRAKLDNYIRDIERALERRVQLPKDDAVQYEKMFMEGLVDAANDKKDGLNAYFLSDVAEFGAVVKDFVQQGYDSFRVIAVPGEGGIHFAVFDVYKSEDKISVVGIESATFDTQGDGPGRLAFGSRGSLKREIPDASFVFFASDLQRSWGECGMFSLALAKKMFKERAAMKVVHDKNIRGEFSSFEDSLPATLFPPSFMKHAQSEKRLEEYLSQNPEAAMLPVNKGGETLRARQARHMVDATVGEKRIRYSNSIEMKRLTEFKALREYADARGTRSGPNGSD